MATICLRSTNFSEAQRRWLESRITEFMQNLQLLWKPRQPWECVRRNCHGFTPVTYRLAYADLLVLVRDTKTLADAVPRMCVARVIVCFVSALSPAVPSGGTTLPAITPIAYIGLSLSYAHSGPCPCLYGSSWPRPRVMNRWPVSTQTHR
jgi:hypothetical protein